MKKAVSASGMNCGMLLSFFLFLFSGCGLNQSSSLSTSATAAIPANNVSQLIGNTAASSRLSFGASCPAGSSCSYQGNDIDFSPLTMACASGVLSVESATYGYGSMTESCSSYVGAMCNGRNACAITFDPVNCGGDPDVGVRKSGEIEVVCSNAAATSSGGAPTQTTTGTVIGSPTNTSNAPRVVSSAGSVPNSFMGLTIPQNMSLSIGALELTMQGDGNLVLHQGGNNLWNSITGGKNCGVSQCQTLLQPDGNLVVYNGSTPLWSSGTAGHPGDQLVISGTAPYLQITQGQSILWSSSYVFKSLVIPQNTSVFFGGLQLAMQSDGNLVLYQGVAPLWSSGTGGQSCGANQCSAVMQSDGNFVVYNGANPLWSSETGGHPGSQLYLSGDSPYLAIVDSGNTTLWANTCLLSGDDSTINNALNAAGPNSVVSLCPNSIFRLRATVHLNQNGQELSTLGYPTDGTRATLIVSDPSFYTAIGSGSAGVTIKNLIVDGNRPVLGYVDKNTALIYLGNNVNQTVDHVRAFEPRGWSTIYFENDSSCHNGTITNNFVGPSGTSVKTNPSDPNQDPWADGISLQCTGSNVSGNMIVDATDGGIVVFGSRNSTVQNNTIMSQNRSVLTGLAISDHYDDGNNSQVLISNNYFDAQGSFMKIAIGAGPGAGSCTTSAINFGATIENNNIHGNYLGYGIAVSNVSNFTIQGNQYSANYVGTPYQNDPSCNQNVAAPGPLVMNKGSSVGSFQGGFSNGAIAIVFHDPAIPDWTNASLGAAYVSQNVPSTMIAGHSYMVSITMKNTGQATWTYNDRYGYKLRTESAQDNLIWGTNRALMADGDYTIPGQPVTFTFNVVAPAVPGNYPFQWQMLRENYAAFGDFTAPVSIQVTP